MAEIKENETTETLSSKALPPEFLTGRKLDYAVNLIKDNPLDETNQKIIKEEEKNLNAFIVFLFFILKNLQYLIGLFHIFYLLQ